MWRQPGLGFFNQFFEDRPTDRQTSRKRRLGIDTSCQSIQKIECSSSSEWHLPALKRDQLSRPVFLNGKPDVKDFSNVCKTTSMEDNHHKKENRYSESTLLQIKFKIQNKCENG